MTNEELVESLNNASLAEHLESRWIDPLELEDPETAQLFNDTGAAYEQYRRKARLLLTHVGY